jgi:hypothetical protein
MRVYLDTEFLEDQFLSIGLVREDDFTFYAVSAEFVMPDYVSREIKRGVRFSRIWFKRKILKHTLAEAKMPLDEIKRHVANFIRDARLIVANEPDFPFLDQLAEYQGRRIMLEKVPELKGCKLKRPTRHHALDDAWHHRRKHELLKPERML